VDTLLDIVGITKSYGAHRVLTGVDLTVGRGEVIGVVGENGAGKTTLMSIFSGHQRADGGTMRLNNAPYWPRSAEDAQSRGVGIIQQNYSLDPNLTVARAIFRNTYQADRPQRALAKPAQWLLDEAAVGLNPDTRLGDLAHAEQGLVEAVRLLAEDAQLVIMDEVGATLNVREIDQLHFIISRLTRQGRSVLYVSHRLAEVQAVANRVAVVRGGTIPDLLDPRAVTTDQIADSMRTTKAKRGWFPDSRKASEEPATPAPARRRRARRSLPADDGRSFSEEGEGRRIVLEIEGLQAPGLNGTPAHDISFVVHTGEVVGLSGPRHGGQDAVAAALNGRAPGTFRRLRINGYDRRITSPRDATELHIAYLAGPGEESARERQRSVARAMMTTGWSEGADFEAEVDGLADMMGALDRLQAFRNRLRGRRAIRRGEDHAKAAASSLSGGQQQMVLLDNWMSADADVLIVTEPSRGLDPDMREAMRKRLAEARDDGAAVLLISSDPDELSRACNRVLLMNKGRIVDSVEGGAMNRELVVSALRRVL